MCLTGWHLWVIAALVFFIVEVITPGGFLFACLGVGFLASALAAFLGLGLAWQVLAFAVISLAFFAVVRPLFLKYFAGGSDQVRTNVEALVGRVGRITEAVEPLSNRGRVLVGGEDWRAVSAQDTPIPAGERVIVVAVDGVKLVVDRAP